MADWNPRANALFLEAIELPPADRPAFLDHRCGADSVLHNEVEALIQAHAEAGTFLTGPHPDADATRTAGDSLIRQHDPDHTRSTADHPTAALALPDGLLAGRYRLLEPLGEGGMGTVYRAEQLTPVKRTVAVKLIKTGTDTARVVARFEAERQALAVMDHPNIAKVLDAGTTPTGQPFFVMELVDGVPLTAFADSHRLTIPARLELFALVCQAVQHAHQKGIIHRDLKPGNVLVTEVDGKPVPKVIDFGLAKALQAGAIPDVSLDATGFGSILGTPLYMAPEQADPGTTDVDTRADVYALGVLLYELLVGSTPHTRETFRKAALSEILRIVREVDPPTPVKRLDSSEAMPNIAAVRQVEPARLSRLVRGDLEWVTMKALAKDRNHRYPSAAMLADDVQRYLAHEPVTAGPPGRWYRVQKFVRRNRGAVLAAAAVLVVLLGGIVGTTLGLMEANRQKGHAEEAAEREKDERKRAEDTSDMAFARLYISDIQRVQRALDERQYDAARDLLVGLTPEHTGGKDLRRFEWHLQHQRVGNLVRKVPFTVKSGSSLNCGAVSGDATRFATALAGEQPQCVVYDRTAGSALRTWDLKAPNYPSTLALCDDGSRLACGTVQGQLFVWDTTDGKELFRTVPAGMVHKVQFDRRGGRVVAALGRTGAIVWDVAGGKELARFNGHRGVCRSAAISPDGKTAVSVARVEEGEKVKGEAKVWNAETGEEIASLTTPRELFKVAYRPDGRQIAAYGVNLQAGLGHDADLVLWDHTAGTHTVNALPKSDAISFSSRCLNYSPDSTRIVSGCGSDGALRVWEAASGIELHNLKGHPAEVMEAAFTPDGHRLFSIGLDDPELFEWDLTRPLWERDVPIPDAQPNGIYSVALSPDGKLAAMEFPPRRILIWDVDHGKVSRTLDTPSQRVLGFTPDGRRLLTSEWLDNNTLTVWDTATWSTKNAWPLPRETTATEQSSAVSPDGSRVFLAMSDGGTRAYDLESGREVGRYEWTGGKLGPNDAGAMLHRFSPDGRYLATREGDPLVVRDVSDGTVVTRIENNPGDNFTFLSDSRLLTCDSGRFKVWELPSGRLLQTAPCLTPAQSLTLLPGGDRVAGYTIAGVRTFNYTLRVWETTSWNEVLALPTPPTVSLGVSADGRRIVVGSNTLRIWDAPGMPAGRGGGGSR